MLKKLLTFLLCFIVWGTGVLAQTVDEHTVKLMETLKTYRSSIYESLDLTAEQNEQIKAIDSKLYSDLEPDMKKISVMVKRIEDIANSENCTKKAILNVRKEFKDVEKSMETVKKAYSKEFKKVLTAEQKKQYRLVRAQKLAQFKAQQNLKL